MTRRGFPSIPISARPRSSGELLFGTVDTYLMWRLSGGSIHATDYTNASRTMLFDIGALRWDDELCELFGVPQSMLPKVCASGHLFGYTDESEVGAKIAISAVAGDQQAALFGQLCTEKGDIKNTYGTGCFTLMNTGTERMRSKRGLITTLAAVGDGQKPQYVLEGSVFVGGAVIQWLRDELRMIETSAETEQIALSVPDNRPGVHRTGRAALGRARARHRLRHYARHGQGALCQSGARIDRLSGGRRHARDGERRRI